MASSLADCARWELGTNLWSRPWQNGFAEWLIGLVRHLYVDHIIVLSDMPRLKLFAILRISSLRSILVFGRGP